MTTFVDLPFDCVRSVCAFLGSASRYFFRYTCQHVKQSIKKPGQLSILRSAYRHSHIVYLDLFKDMGMKVMNRDYCHLPTNSVSTLRWYFANLSENFDDDKKSVNGLATLLLKRTKFFNVFKYTLDRFSQLLSKVTDNNSSLYKYITIESQFRINEFMPNDSPYNAKELLKQLKKTNDWQFYTLGCYHTLRYLHPSVDDCDLLVTQSARYGNFGLADKFWIDNSKIPLFAQKILAKPKIVANFLIWFHKKGILTIDQIMEHWGNAMKEDKAFGTSYGILQYFVKNGLEIKKDSFTTTNWRFCKDNYGIRFLINQGIDPDTSGFMINRRRGIARRTLFELGFR